MPEETPEHYRREDIIALAQVKQTLVILGATLSLVVVIFPLLMSRLYTKLDTINTNTTHIATVQAQMTSMQRDIDRIMLWVDRERGTRVSSTIATELCETECTPVVQMYALKGKM